MTARALQRVVVRMLYDPALVDAIYADVHAALADDDLTAEERRWLVAPDRRRWAADPLRRARGLQAMLEEYPTAGALTVRRRGVPVVDAFFSTPAFHRCVQQRGSLARAFGDHLRGLGDREVAALATLEQAIAAVRRAPPRRAPGPPRTDRPWQTAPWARGVRLPAGTLASWQALRGALAARTDGILGFLVADSKAPLPHPALSGSAEEGLVVEWLHDAAVGEAPLPLVDLLTRLRAPTDWPAVVAALADLGVEADEAVEVAGDLLAEGLLVVC